MDALKYATGASVPLESVLCTEELQRRPSRPPDYQAENRALLALAQELTNSPEGVLQRLVDIALELCRGHSAGISLLEEGPPGHLSPRGDHFRWHAVAGQWAPLIWQTTTRRDYGPCGTVLDRNCTLLFANAHRYYTQFAGVEPLLIEGLLVPFSVAGQAVGTVWVVAHDDRRKFDAEDRRLLESLATFAATAYQVRVSLSAQAKGNQDLQAEIAERQRAEEALRQSERRFRAMIDALPAAIYTTDAEGRLTYFNPAAVAFSGRVPELGTDQWCVSWKLSYPDGTPMPHDACAMAIALTEGRAVHGVEAIAERPDGTRLWFTPYPTPLHDSAARIVGGINMLVDITERKQAEQARAQLAAIVASSDDAIISKDLNGIISSWNHGAERLFGYTAPEAIGQPVTMLIPPGRLDEEPRILERIRRGERIDHYETVRRRKDGTLLHISLCVSPVTDTHGTIVGASKIARDITERKQAEETVRQRTVQFETLLNAAPLGVYLVDADFRMRQVNPTALSVFGDIPDLIGRDFDEVIHRLWSQASADDIVRLFRHTLATGEPYMTPEWSEERRDRGMTEYYEWQIHRIPLPDGRDGVVCYFRDIAAQVMARQAITASEARYRQLTATLEQRVAERTDLLALIQDVTRAANEAPSSAAALQYAVDRLCAYAGWPVGHVYLAVAPGANRWAPTTLWHLDVPERFTAFQQATQVLEVAAGEGLIGRVGARGQPEWQREVATDPTVERRHAAHEAGLTTGVAWPILVGQEVAGVLEFYTPEALAPHPALLEAMTQIGTQLGRAVERERAAAQAQRQQEALFQREKLAAMGALLANVAHELNNPLAIILMQADLLREDADSGPLAETAAELTQAATRCERLVRAFLTLARQHAPERTVVDLNTLMTDTLELLAPLLRVDDVAVDLRLAGALPRLWADPHQLQQVLVNLLTNAQQALRDVARPRQVTLTTWYDPACPQVTLEVADTGPGMPPAIRTRIFEPFFTTKAPGVGTGLGLPLCQGIIESHGGTMSVTSLPGQGTTFRIALPLGVTPETILVPLASARAPSTVPSSTILLVDDEPGITKALTHLLRRDGHTVDTAANGRLALARLQERPYDLILSDLRMPELDGPGLYRALAQQASQLCQRFIFLTGDTLSPETLAFFNESGVPRLTKPFSAAEVRRIIAQALRAV